MPLIGTLARKAAVLAFASTAFATAAPAGPAKADDSHIRDGVTGMEILAHPPGPQVVVRNVAGSHDIGSLDLAIQGSTVAVSVGVSVGCAGTESQEWWVRSGYALRGGTFGIGRSSLVMAQILPDPKSIDHTSDMDAHVFQLPVAKLAHPEIAVDPVAVVLAAAEQAPNKVQWLRQDHTLTVKIPLRLQAVCAFYARNTIKKETVWESIDSGSLSYVTRDVELKVRYEGDPQLFGLNAQIGQSQQPGGFHAGPQPLVITSAQFPHDMPHHVGACPATKQVRVFYQGQGQGELRIRLSAGNTPLQESGAIAYDSKNHTQNYVFELETPKGAALNNTIMHNLRVFVVTRSAGEQAWSNDYRLMDQAVWKTRCTPAMNPVLGGGPGGKAPAYQQGGAGAKPSPALQLKQAPAAPAPRVIRRVQ